MRNDKSIERPQKLFNIAADDVRAILL